MKGQERFSGGIHTEELDVDEQEEEEDEEEDDGLRRHWQ